jgi:SNF family Na+-dependent transporter
MDWKSIYSMTLHLETSIQLNFILIYINKIVWFTSLFPYVLLFTFLIKGFMLPGAWEGIQYLFTFQFYKLTEGLVNILTKLESKFN